MPHNFLALWTGQRDKESKIAELCMNRQPGRQSWCYLFAPYRCPWLCPWNWDFRFIIKILSVSCVVTEFANTCTGWSHFLNPGCRMLGQWFIMHFVKCFSFYLENNIYWLQFLSAPFPWVPEKGLQDLPWQLALYSFMLHTGSVLHPFAPFLPSLSALSPLSPNWWKYFSLQRGLI